MKDSLKWEEGRLWKVIGLSGSEFNLPSWVFWLLFRFLGWARWLLTPDLAWLSLLPQDLGQFAAELLVPIFFHSGVSEGALSLVRRFWVEIEFLSEEGELFGCLMGRAVLSHARESLFHFFNLLWRLFVLLFNLLMTLLALLFSRHFFQLSKLDALSSNSEWVFEASLCFLESLLFGEFTHESTKTFNWSVLLAKCLLEFVPAEKLVSLSWNWHVNRIKIRWVVKSMLLLETKGLSVGHVNRINAMSERV